MKTATYRITQMEVGTGEPGYRWVEAYEVIDPDGHQLAPYMRPAEARRFAREQGWTLTESRS